MIADRVERIRLMRLKSSKLRGYINIGALLCGEEPCSISTKAKFIKWLGREAGVGNSDTHENSIDYILKRISREFGPFKIEEVPELLSAVGSLIDSTIVLEVEMIIERYLEIMQETYSSEIELTLLKGYKPHVNLIRSFPRSIYDHPRHIAPVEDLLDSIAKRHYLGKEPCNSVCGAVGWVVTHAHKTAIKQIEIGDFVSQLSLALKHLTQTDLNHAIEVWQNIVKPKLQEFDGSNKSQIEQNRNTQPNTTS